MSVSATIPASGVPSWGTSYAAPHVAGAWAVMKSVFPSQQDAPHILEWLQTRGIDVTDTRVPGGRHTPRLDLAAALDPDMDGVFHPLDNCTTRANPTGCDADQDGYGNTCDCDLNQSGSCNTSDIPPFKAALANNEPKGDLNCDGTTNTSDIPFFNQLLQDPEAPGPSGLGCAGTVPCP